MAQRETRRWQKFLVMNFQLGKGWNSLATYHAKFTRRVSKAQRRLAPASLLPCVRSKWNAKLRCAETTRKRAMVKEHRLNAVPDTVVHGSCAVFAQASFRAASFHAGRSRSIMMKAMLEATFRVLAERTGTLIITPPSGNSRGFSLDGSSLSTPHLQL
jgi:hypothetical protein